MADKVIAIEVDVEVGGGKSIDELEARLKAINARMDQLKKKTPLTPKLFGEKNKLKKEAKEIETAIKNTQKATEGANNSFKKTKESSAVFTEGVTGMSDAMGEFAGGSAAAQAGITGIQKAMSGSLNVWILLATAILAVGLALKDAFTRTEEGQNKFNRLAAVSGAFMDELAERAGDLGIQLIDAFENPKKAMQDFGQLIKENFINRFNGLLELIPNLGKAINELFKGNFAEAGSIALDSVSKITLGIENMTDKLKDAAVATKELLAAAKAEAIIAGEIADLRAAADKLDRRLLVERAQANQKIADLRRKFEQKDQFALQERIKFLKEANDLEDTITAKEQNALKVRLKAITTEINIQGANKDRLKEQAQLRADIINLDTQRLEKQASLIAQIQALISEEAALEAARKKLLTDESDKQTLKEIEDEKKRVQALEAILQSAKNKEEDIAANTEVKKLELSKERAIQELELLQATEQQKADIINFFDGQLNEARALAAKDQTRIDAEEAQARFEIAANAVDSISSLLDTFNDDQEKKSKLAFEITKGLRVAETVINTYAAATNIMANSKTPAPGPFIEAAAAVVVGLANVKKILSTKIGSTTATGSISSTGLNATQLQPQQTGFTDLRRQAIDVSITKPIKAFVVESDLRDVSGRVDDIIDVSTII